MRPQYQASVADIFRDCLLLKPVGVRESLDKALQNCGSSIERLLEGQEPLTTDQAHVLKKHTQWLEEMWLAVDEDYQAWKEHS